MKKLSLIFLIPAFLACSTGKPPLPADHFIPGIAGPLRLASHKPEIYLSDFVPDATIIDSVWLNGKKINYPSSSEPMKPIYLSIPQDADPLLELRIWSKGSWQSVPVLKSRKVDYVYSFDPKGITYQTVQIKADFNGWTPSRTNLELKDGKWTAVIPLDPGRYQYLLVTDGKEMLDPANPDSVYNNLGGHNSVLKVGLSDKTKLPFLFTSEFEDHEIEIGWINKPTGIKVFWQNILLDENFLEIDEESLSISIPVEAENHDRSYLRVFAFSNEGLSNDLLIPLNKGKVVLNASELKRNDPQTMIIYNVFVDRFFDGNPDNNKPINDSSLVLPKADWHGGDIAGIVQKLKEGYFTGLGINTIWISPVVLNPDGAYGQWNDPKTKFSAYHGYWPISFTKIDPRFGTSEDLKELVSEAHIRGINVLLDFVAHHVHELHPYYIQHPNWTTSLYLPDGTLNTEKWDEHRLTTWFDVFLPTLDLQQPEVTEMLSDSAVWWIKEYGLDGFRHDATKHIPEIFQRTLTKKLKQQIVTGEGRPVYQIGETYGGPPLISSYVGSGLLDGQFDFNVYDAAIGVFARQTDPFTNLDNTLQTSFDYYGPNNLMGYISGNQDRGRFISYAGGDLKFDENAKAAGWKRNIGVGDTLSYRKLRMLNAFNMTIPGLPVIYYGDEIGIPGGNDPDSRRMMKFENLDASEAATKTVVSQLTKIRRENLALTYGNFQVLQVTDTTYIYARQYFSHTAIMIFNKANNPVEITVNLPVWLNPSGLSAEFGNNFSVTENSLTIELAPWSFEIISKP